MVVKSIYAEACSKALFNLPLLLHSKRPGDLLILVTWEKDIRTLVDLTLEENITFMVLHWKGECAYLLKDANVVVLYDYDWLGLQRKELLCAKLHGLVSSLKVVDLPGVKYRKKHGRGISYWIKNGHTKEDLLGLIKKASEYKPDVLKGRNHD